MVGTKKALAYAVNHVTVTNRNTLLKERLVGDKDKSHDEHKVISYLDVMESKISDQSREQNLRVAEATSYKEEGFPISP